MRSGPTLLFHCGTGSTLTAPVHGFLDTTMAELDGLLESGQRALDLAVTCVSRLEESGFFNAGRGAVSQADGVVRRDVGAMDGGTLKALGLSQVRGIPKMARLVAALLGQSDHVHLSGQMVERWAERHGWFLEARAEKEDPTFLWDARSGQAGEGTVGCVVRDSKGNLAAVTSTGGIGRMWPGRIGDSPIVGGGFYADNEVGAISMTGIGEAILKVGGGSALLFLLGNVCEGEKDRVVSDFLDRIKSRFLGVAGFVGIDRGGQPFAAHSSERMVHGIVRKDFRQVREVGAGFFPVEPS